jgi:hypothetical protein
MTKASGMRGKQSQAAARRHLLGLIIGALLAGAPRVATDDYSSTRCGAFQKRFQGGTHQRRRRQTAIKTGLDPNAGLKAETLIKTPPPIDAEIPQSNHVAGPVVVTPAAPLWCRPP